MRRTIGGLSAIYLLVAIAELAFHWYVMSVNTDFADRIRHSYSDRSPVSGKVQLLFVVIQTLIPAVIVGLSAGLLGFRARSESVIACAFAASFGVAILIPFELWDFAGNSDWWPRDNANRKMLMVGFACGLGGIVSSICCSYTLAGMRLLWQEPEKDERQSARDSSDGEEAGRIKRTVRVILRASGTFGRKDND